MERLTVDDADKNTVHGDEGPWPSFLHGDEVDPGGRLETQSWYLRYNFTSALWPCGREHARSSMHGRSRMHFPGHNQSFLEPNNLTNAFVSFSSVHATHDHAQKDAQRRAVQTHGRYRVPKQLESAHSIKQTRHRASKEYGTAVSVLLYPHVNDLKASMYIGAFSFHHTGERVAVVQGSFAVDWVSEIHGSMAAQHAEGNDGQNEIESPQVTM